MTQFRALVVSNADDVQHAKFSDIDETDLMPGDVDVRVTHSTVNYKDGLVLSGKSPLVRQFPMIAGVDFAGIVTASTHPRFKAGDDVIANGFGLSERHFGGYAQRARVSGDFLVKRPDIFTRAETMAIGTAGYTAMLCVLALEAHGLTPDQGPIAVSGAAGGVGSIAVAVLAKLGYRVIASTGRKEETEFLKTLGAAEVIDRADLSGPAKPLGRERWAGAIDVAGSHTLANLISMTQYGGCVAATGLAQGVDLPGSVMPFILRGVTLAGVDSVMAPLAKRERAWARLATDLDRTKLSELTVTHPWTDVLDLASQIRAGQIRGRIVLEIS